MKIYSYSYETKEFTESKEAQIDPLESMIAMKNIYLLPANATFTKPPDAGENEKQIWDEKNEKWYILDDYRGVFYYDENNEYVISKLGEKPPKNTSLKPKPDMYSTLINGEWVKDLNKIKKDKIKDLSFEMQKYIFEDHKYNLINQITLLSIQNDMESNENQKKSCKEIFDWIKNVVMIYYYSKKEDIELSEKPEDISWDFTSCDSNAPIYTLKKIINMKDNTKFTSSNKCIIIFKKCIGACKSWGKNILTMKNFWKK